MNKIKALGGVLLGIAAASALFLIMYAFITGTARVAEWLAPLLTSVNGYALGISIVVLLPMALFRASRGWAAVGFMVVSFVFGFVMWMFGFLYTYILWGVLGIVVGIFLAGIGVVPIGMLALAIHGEWELAGQLLFGLVLTFGTRAFAMYLSEKADREAAERAAKVITIESR